MIETLSSPIAGAGAAVKFLRPAGMDSVADWAEKKIWLTDRYSPTRPGRLSLDSMPYLREVLDSATNPAVHELTLCFAVQCGKSTALQLILAHRISNRPTPAIVVLPSMKLARSISAERWMELVKANECLAKLCPDDEDEMKLDEQRFKSSTVWWVGASPSQLSSRSAGLCIADEIDKFPDWQTKESSPLQLIGARMESFPNWLYVQASTPTMDHGVNIWTEFMRGDQRYYFVSCPDCRHEFALDWSGIRWDESAQDQDTGQWNLEQVKTSTHYECPGCRRKILFHERAEMMKAGRWKPTAQGQPGRRSYNLPALYSPNRTWGELAVMFLQDKESIRGLHHFVNSYMAKPWTPAAATIKPSSIEDVIKGSPEYVLGEVPLDPIGMIMAVDVQQTELFFVIRAYGKVGDKPWSALVDYGQLIGWDAVMQKFATTYPVKGTDKKAGCIGGLVDSGYAARRTGGVYEFVIKSGGRFWASKGRGSGSGMKASVLRQTVEHLGRTLPLVQYSDDIFKQLLYIAKIKERTGSDWWLPRNTGRDYFTQLTGERMVERKLRFGQRELVWEKVGPNHLGDCEKLVLVALENIQSQNP